MALLKKMTLGIVVLVGGFIGAMTALPGYGTMLTFNNGELYYTENVTVDEANKLGEFLVETELFDGTRKTVQLDKQNGVYQFRVVVLPGYLDKPEMKTFFRVFGKDICSEVLAGQPLEIHMTDDFLKTKRVIDIVQSYGERLEFLAGELYYADGVTEAEAVALGEYLVKAEFYDDTPKTVQLKKRDSVVEFRFVIRDDLDPNDLPLSLLRTFAAELSEGVFESAPVEVHATDASLETLKIATSDWNVTQEAAVNGSTNPLLSEQVMLQIGEELLKDGLQ
jgi:hypothetical protein